MKKYDDTCDKLGVKHLIQHTSVVDGSKHLYMIRIDDIYEEDRHVIIKKMGEKGVSTNVHYKPLPMMTAYGKHKPEDYPNSYDYYKNLVTLPFHTLLSDEDIGYICEVLKEVVEESRKTCTNHA